MWSGSDYAVQYTERVSARGLAILSFSCALLSFPAFVIGSKVGRHIGYDASAETAILASLGAGTLALAFGVAAGVRGDRRLALVAVVGSLIVIGVVIWVATQLIAAAA
jgi:hypothetical protein